MFGNLRISHVEFRFPGSEKLGPAGMVEWNGIFRLFRFSGILGQPREVHPKFRNEIPENVCSIRSLTRNLQNFWSNGKPPEGLGKAVPNMSNLWVRPVINSSNGSWISCWYSFHKNASTRWPWRQIWARGAATVLQWNWQGRIWCYRFWRVLSGKT